jgi:hypothetical protein
MKLLIKILTIVTSFFLIPGNMLMAQECKGSLIVETSTEDALIYINENIEGKGRLETELDVGTYIVKVIENNRSWDSKIYIDTVFLESCNHKKLNYNFNSDVYIQTEPDDAAVFRNDSLLGYTPLFIPNNYRSLKLSKLGYEDKLISLDEISRSNSINLNFKDESALNGDKESFFEKDLFKYLVGSIVVLGGTTAYFKLKADDRFDEYKITGEKALLDEIDKYDLISGITFTALQINFGLLIYYFLID